MELRKQPAAIHGNGFRLFARFLARGHLPLFATGCDRGAPQRLHTSLGIQNDSMRGRVHRSRIPGPAEESYEVGVRLDDRERWRLRRRGDGDSAARFLLERDAYLVAWQVERFGDVVADPDGEGLAEGTLVAEAA